MRHPQHIRKAVTAALHSQKGPQRFRSIGHVEDVIDAMYVLRPGLLFGELSKPELFALAAKAEKEVGQPPLF